MSFIAQPAANFASPPGLGTTTPNTGTVTTFHAAGASALDGNVTCGSNLDVSNGHVGASAGSGLYLINAANFTAPVNGVIVMTNGSNFTDVNRLCWGGIDATYASLKRSGTKLIFRLADDSADSPAQFSRVTISAIPTSASGLSSGDVYSNAGILTIVP